jgi:hypothetical protein
MSQSLARALHQLAHHPFGPGWAGDVEAALARAERWLLRVPADYLDGHDHVYLLVLAAAISREMRSGQGEVLCDRLDHFAAVLGRLATQSRAAVAGFRRRA